ncbi:MAG: iron-containing alcohol dehydrogenase [Nitrososphaerota archaeon]|nr:iron-containing alcohol dehydrogenase [Nitrososphaerota archaeon]
MFFSNSLPRKIFFGRGSLERLPEALRELELTGRAILVTGRHFARKSGYLDKLCSLMRFVGVDVIVYDKVEPNPSIEIVEEGGRIAREKGVDFVVGFGGGSAIDTAKGIAVLATHNGGLEEYFYPAKIEPPLLPIVAIPTTCGSGSEVTRYAIVSKGFRKYTILSELIVPTLTILDSEVLKYLARDITAHTAMDAFSHALESYYHINSCEFSENFARDAIIIFFENLRDAVDGDMGSREKIFYASMLAGLAINLAGTLFVHSLGYYITQKFGIPHGLANMLFLRQFIEYAAEKMPDRTIALGRLLGLNSVSSEIVSRTIINKLNDLIEYLDLPRNLKEAGIPHSELFTIAEHGFSYKRNIENCRKPPTSEEIQEIVKKAYLS